MAVLSHVGPTRADLAAVAASVVRAVRGIGTAMLPVAALGLLLGEVTAASGLVLGWATTVLVTAPARAVLPGVGRLTWSQAFTSAGLGWLAAATFAAVPLVLSPNYGRTLHAMVEAMAGLTTTGASLAQDLDHLAVATNLWRHALHPLGAIAALLVVASVRLRGEIMVATSTVAEPGEHRVLPSGRGTLRVAARLVAAYCTLGTVVLTVLAALAGATPPRAVLHGLTLATSAFSTGGFTLTSASAGALHSAAVELVLALLMFAGATSLVLHRAAATRRLRRVVDELDVRVLWVTGSALTLVVLLGLARSGAHTSFEGLLRHGVFHTIAAHTTTGFTIGSGRLLSTGWGDLAPAALVTAMGIGGMSGSIAGGIGTLRVGLVTKGVLRDVRALLLPENAVVRERYVQRRVHTLTDEHVRASATTLLLLLGAVFAGATVELATTTSGSLPEALFAATSAVSTTGMSIGFVEPTVSDLAVLTSGLLMWFGRLEFLAVLAAFGLLARGLPGVGGHR